MIEVLIALDEVRRWSERTFEPDKKGVPEETSGGDEHEATGRNIASAVEGRFRTAPRSGVSLLQRVLARYS